jgi:hypothetical protein
MTDDQNDQLPMAASSATAQVDDATDFQFSDDESPADGTETIGEPTVRTGAQKRRRGSRGGRNRKKPAGAATAGGIDDSDSNDDDDSDGSDVEHLESSNGESYAVDSVPVESSGIPITVELDGPELPKRLAEGRASIDAAERALVRKPQIGDTRPAPPGSVAPAPAPAVKPAQQRGDRSRNDRP